MKLVYDVSTWMDPDVAGIASDDLLKGDLENVEVEGKQRLMTEEPMQRLGVRGKICGREGGSPMQLRCKPAGSPHRLRRDNISSLNFSWRRARIKHTIVVRQSNEWCKYLDESS